jgi:hypothetical protein
VVPGGCREASCWILVGKHVRISKEKMKFAKPAEHNFSTKIFRKTKVIDRHPRTVYELEDSDK